MLNNLFSYCLVCDEWHCTSPGNFDVSMRRMPPSRTSVWAGSGMKDPTQVPGTREGPAQRPALGGMVSSVATDRENDVRDSDLIG